MNITFCVDVATVCVWCLWMLLIGIYTFLVGSPYFMVGWYIGGRRCYSSTAGFYVVGWFLIFDFSLQSYDTYHGLTLRFPTLVLHFDRLSVVGSIISNQKTIYVGLSPANHLKCYGFETPTHSRGFQRSTCSGYSSFHACPSSVMK